jgi:hypothetical protein
MAAQLLLLSSSEGHVACGMWAASEVRSSNDRTTERQPLGFHLVFYGCALCDLNRGRLLGGPCSLPAPRAGRMAGRQPSLLPCSALYTLLLLLRLAFPPLCCCCSNSFPVARCDCGFNFCHSTENWTSYGRIQRTNGAGIRRFYVRMRPNTQKPVGMEGLFFLLPSASPRVKKCSLG